MNSAAISVDGDHLRTSVLDHTVYGAWWGESLVSLVIVFVLLRCDPVYGVWWGASPQSSPPSLSRPLVWVVNLSCLSPSLSQSTGRDGLSCWRRAYVSIFHISPIFVRHECSSEHPFHHCRSPHIELQPAALPAHLQQWKIDDTV